MFEGAHDVICNLSSLFVSGNRLASCAFHIACYLMEKRVKKQSSYSKRNFKVLYTIEKSFPALILSETKHQVFSLWLRQCFTCCHPDNIMTYLLRSINNVGYNTGAPWKPTPFAFICIVSYQPQPAPPCQHVPQTSWAVPGHLNSFENDWLLFQMTAYTNFFVKRSA